MNTDNNLNQLSIATIRTLVMDAIEQANSGHPGTPMGMAPVAYTLWQRFLRFDPANPIWPKSRSKETRPLLSQKMWQCVFSATVGMCGASATRMTSSAWKALMNAMEANRKAAVGED